jgi:hypothetical protein
MIKVTKLYFKYGKYDVFKVTSDDIDLPISLNNTYILDTECEENNFKVPSAFFIEREIINCLNIKNISKINGFLTTKNDLDYNTILQLERENKLESLI